MNNNRGSIAFAFLLLTVLVVLDATVLMRSVNESQVAQRFAYSSAALWAAEAGVAQVLYQYNRNRCQGMVQTGTTTACISCSNCGQGSLSYSATLAGYGDYDVTLNNGLTTIQSIGSVVARTAANRVQRRIQASIGYPRIFANGIYAQGQVTLANNAVVDSFNSDRGPYGGSNILSNGNIGTNGTTPGIVTVDNNATVNGNVGTGPGGTVSQGNNSVITGTVYHNSSVALPAVVVPSTLTSLPNGGSYRLANNASGSLTAGNYKYTNLNLANNSTLTIRGNVSLYLTGSTSLATGNNVSIVVANAGSLSLYVDGVFSVRNNVTINTVSQRAKQLQIYSTYTGDNGVNVHNNGTLYAAVYAPQTDVILNNNIGFYGATVGKTVTLNNNGAVHYDEALSSNINPFGDAIISNWQEY